MVVVKHLYFKLKKFFLIVIIIFSNTSFGKEFNELFIINEPISSSSEIEKTINKSFNRMIYRLIGKNDGSYGFAVRFNSMKEYGIAQDKLNSEEYFSNHRDFLDGVDWRGFSLMRILETTWE